MPTFMRSADSERGRQSELLAAVHAQRLPISLRTLPDECANSVRRIFNLLVFTLALWLAVSPGGFVLAQDPVRGSHTGTHGVKVIEPEVPVNEAPQDEARQHVERAQTYVTQRMWKKAIKEFTRALSLQPKNATLYNTRGLVWIEMADFPRAIRDFSSAIHFDPKYAEAYANRGIAQLRQGNSIQASTNFARSKALDKQMEDYIEKAISKK